MVETTNNNELGGIFMKVRELLKMVDMHNENSSIFLCKFTLTVYCNDLLCFRKVKTSEEFTEKLKEYFSDEMCEKIMSEDFLVADGVLIGKINVGFFHPACSENLAIYIDISQEEY